MTGRLSTVCSRDTLHTRQAFALCAGSTTDRKVDTCPRRPVHRRPQVFHAARLGRRRPQGTQRLSQQAGNRYSSMERDGSLGHNR